MHVGACTHVILYLKQPQSLEKSSRGWGLFEIELKINVMRQLRQIQNHLRLLLNAAINAIHLVVSFVSVLFVSVLYLSLYKSVS